MKLNCVIFMVQNSSNLRSMNLARQSFNAKAFTKMPNLHYLILDGCSISGNFDNIFKELRFLQWRHIPNTYIPDLQNLSNLVSIDLSGSTNLVNTWANSIPALEVRYMIRI